MKIWKEGCVSMLFIGVLIGINFAVGGYQIYAGYICLYILGMQTVFTLQYAWNGE